MERVTGRHFFKIVGYLVDNGVGKGEFLESTVFTVGGYDWSIHCYPNGCKEALDNSISIFLCLKSKADAVVTEFDFTILDQGRMTTPIRRSCRFQSFNSSNNDRWGFLDFAEKTRLVFHLKEDCFIIQCTVGVLMVPKVEPVLPIVPPVNIQQQLGFLLDKGNGADVMFEVEGQTFGAHKCILAARSPVFREQLFGPLKVKMGSNIKIKDMDVSIFKAMLHFMYSDTCPEIEEVGENKENQQKVFMAQHLLVAADRYALERLKVICEKILYDSIDASNVVTMLSLADQHNCTRLKLACLKFLASPEIFGLVIATDEFENLIRSRSSILKELSEKQG